MKLLRSITTTMFLLVSSSVIALADGAYGVYGKTTKFEPVEAGLVESDLMFVAAIVFSLGIAFLIAANYYESKLQKDFFLKS